MGKHGDGKAPNTGKSNPDKTGKTGKHHGGNLHSEPKSPSGGDPGGKTPGGAGDTG